MCGDSMSIMIPSVTMIENTNNKPAIAVNNQFSREPTGRYDLIFSPNVYEKYAMKYPGTR